MGLIGVKIELNLCRVQLILIFNRPNWGGIKSTACFSYIFNKRLDLFHLAN